MDCANPAGSHGPTLPSFPSDPPFVRHTDSVLCCDIDPNGVYAVTGGIDDKAYVWDMSTRLVRFECSGHKESVVACGFSHNSTYVATADMNGYLQVRNTTTGMRIFEFELDEINWIIWHNHSDHVLLAGTVKGDMWMWNIANPLATKTYQSYGAATTAARLIYDGFKIVVAYDNGSVRIIDLKTCELLHHIEGKGEEVTSLDISPNGALIAAGCTNCTTKLISVSSGKQVALLQCAIPKSELPNKSDQLKDDNGIEMNSTDDTDCDVDQEEEVEVFVAKDEEPDDSDHQDSDDDDDDDDEDDENNGEFEEEFEDTVESVAFSRCGNYISTANVSGCISLWDVPTQVIRHRIVVGIGITRSFWDEQNRLICACLDGSLRLLSHNLEELNILHEHQDQILDCYSRRGMLVTASEDKTCRVYNVQEL